MRRGGGGDLDAVAYTYLNLLFILHLKNYIDFMK